MSTLLTKAHQELFRRGPDETFSSLQALHERCLLDKEHSHDLWHPPQELLPTSDMTLCVGNDGAELKLNDWSFSQLCKLAGVSKDTLNRLSSKTASKALQETLPTGSKPLQILARDEQIRSLHGVVYTRLRRGNRRRGTRSTSSGISKGVGKRGTIENGRRSWTGSNLIGSSNTVG